jgi:predicted pyridoxine 5'-phosphate oxidase superfamily flavin-nucleotide-binding protein
MSRAFADVAFTPAVKELQSRAGSREAYARMETRSERDAGLGPAEGEFLARADSFYLATVSETGWPYVQHRGGPPGFLKVISPSQLRIALIDVVAFDWNCPQHITPRFTLEQIRAASLR